MPSQEVTDYIQNIDKPWQVQVCESIRSLVQQAVPEVEERIQYKKPHFLKNGSYLGVISPAKAHVSFAVFNATDLQPPEGFFEKQGPPERRTVKIKEGQDFDYELLGKLVAQAASTL